MTTHVWKPSTDLVAGRYECENCGLKGYRHRDGDIRPYKRQPKTEKKVSAEGNGNYRLGKRGPGGW